MNIHRLPRLYRALLTPRKWLGRCFMRLAHAAGVRRTKIFFSSFRGRQYSDSPRAICELLLKRHPDWDFVWQVPRGTSVPDGVRAVRPHTPRALWEISTARAIVDNYNRPVYMLKFPDQLYVQTWHGDRGFKKMLNDLDPSPGYPDGKQMDLAVAGSRFGVSLYRSAFGYAGEVMAQGIPRNDALVNATGADTEKARRALGLPEGAGVLLYAPTFRNETVGGIQPAGFSLDRALSALEEGTGRPWIALGRAHDLNAGADFGSARCRDVSQWPEMTDLMLASDLLITDYSSCAGDFILLRRPVILYQPDRAQFAANDRQMYFDMDECPHMAALSEEQLMDMLRRLPDLPDVSAQVGRFYGICETGRATQAVCRWIEDRVAAADDGTES